MTDSDKKLQSNAESLSGENPQSGPVMRELLPCPFCGFPVKKYRGRVKDDTTVYYWTRCANDKCVSQAHTVYGNETEAQREWNTRAASRPAVAVDEGDVELIHSLCMLVRSPDHRLSMPNGSVIIDATYADALARILRACGVEG